MTQENEITTKPNLMVIFKTMHEIELFDVRKNSIGFHIIKMIVNECNIDAHVVKPKGYYYYEFEGRTIVLAEINAPFTWEQITLAEMNLDPLANPNSLHQSFIQRIIEFTFIKLQMENGINFGTTWEDWVLVEQNNEDEED